MYQLTLTPICRVCIDFCSFLGTVQYAHNSSCCTLTCEPLLHIYQIPHVEKQVSLVQSSILMIDVLGMYHPKRLVLPPCLCLSSWLTFSLFLFLDPFTSCYISVSPERHKLPTSGIFCRQAITRVLGSLGSLEHKDGSPSFKPEIT